MRKTTNTIVRKTTNTMIMKMRRRWSIKCTSVNRKVVFSISFNYSLQSLLDRFEFFNGDNVAGKEVLHQFH